MYYEDDELTEERNFRMDEGEEEMMDPEEEEGKEVGFGQEEEEESY